MRRSSSSSRRRSYSGDEEMYNILGRCKEKLEQRRREWRIQQERERKHEQLKQQKILEYEKKRTAMLKAGKEHKQKNERRSRSYSPRSSRQNSGPSVEVSTSEKVPMSENREEDAKNDQNVGANKGVLKMLQSSSRSKPLFQGPDGTQISERQLREITVDIKRNIPVTEPIAGELKRNIINPEDVIVKRRIGEGSKPIFDREELKQTETKNTTIEEERIVRVNASKKRSVSLSPSRSYNDNPPKTSHSRHSRNDHDASKLDYDRTYNKDYRKEDQTNKRSSISDSHKYLEDDRRHSENRSRRHHEDYSRRHRRSRSYSRDRSNRHRYSSEHDAYAGSGRSRKDEGRSRERGRLREEEKYHRDRMRSQQAPMDGMMHYSPNYEYERMRSMYVRPPMHMLRPQFVGLRPPCPPRFIPPNAYRMTHPPHPRFGGMY